MPCFNGLAVSIHTNDGPLSEFSVQKVSRANRISTYIPVPPPSISTTSTDEIPKAQPSTFAISITLLTPGQDVPYSTPKPTATNLNPKPRLVGNLPGHDTEPKKDSARTVSPYVPLTSSPNETIAAYIYFDGRAKEEVATLLRKGEETWVNSRWVGVPESEGGGLAEREFLFREVGLERWLNGLDLEGQDAAAIIERRRQKLEKRRRKRKEAIKKENGELGSDDEDGGIGLKRTDGNARKKTLRYGADGQLQELSDEDGSLTDSDSSDDDDPIPEATGQIKVALFRVLASGEIKRGEYSPQFDAHDDDEDESGQNGNAKDVDHTTSFAKPKSLDPKTISTQTVTGIDPTDKPYATFTFFYRGEKQLQKMGILPTPKDKTAAAAKRRSGIPDMPTLGPLKKEGTVGFVGYRENNARRKSAARKSPKDPNAMNSDSEDEEDEMREPDDQTDPLESSKKGAGTGADSQFLSPEDAERAGQVSEGIRKMKLKRQHSAEPLNNAANATATNGVGDASKTPASNSGTPSKANSPLVQGEDVPAGADADGKVTGANMFGEVKKDDDLSVVGSPFKRQRSSVVDVDDSLKERLSGSNLTNASSSISEIIGGPGSKSASGSSLKFGGALLKRTDEQAEEL